MARDTYRGQLDELGGMLVTMAHAAAVAMGRAGAALLESDRAAAEEVLAGDELIDRLRRDVDDLASGLLVRQQPVASDLRLILAAIRVASDLERMGDLAEHVAKIALMRHPVPAVPPPVAEVLAQMVEVAGRLASKAAGVLASWDRLDAAQLGLDDDEMDALQRRLFTLLTDRWPYGVEAAVDAALLGRFFERYADHAVSAARQVVYVVTGSVRLDR
jgi:phosphate transport system protein